MNLPAILLQTIFPALTDSVASPAAEVSMMKNMTLDEIINNVVSGLARFAANLCIAILVFYVGKFIINKLYNVVRAILLRRRVDSSLTSFVLSFVRIVLYFILIVTVIGILGVETSSFLAIFASAGVAIGMALSGTLQNFAGGVLILLLKPYRVGNYIEAQGYAGTVKEIQIFHTLIVTPDNKSIIIPNGGLSTGSVNNWSREEYRRVDWTIGIAYGDDFAKASEAIKRLILDNPDVVKDNFDADRARRRAAGTAAVDLPDDESEQDSVEQDSRAHSILDLFRSKRKRISHNIKVRARLETPISDTTDRSPSVVLTELADSSVQLKARAWAPTTKYWDVYYDVLSRVYTTYKDPNDTLNFPFPQLDVHIQSPTTPTATL